ncbi:MAG TPA: pitrilysin family protein, partial [Limnochordales bacterium]
MTWTAALALAWPLWATGPEAGAKSAAAARNGGLPVPIPLPSWSQVNPAPLPPIVRSTLPNGLDVVVARRPRQPVVALNLLIPAGLAHDPPNLPGLAGFVADMLRQGTARRSAEAVAEDLEATGGRLGVSAGVEFTRLSGQWLSRDLERAVELVAEVVTQPAFAAGELERMRPRWVAQARQAFDDPGELAARYADHLLYGPGHPLGRLPDPGPAMAVRREDLVAFHARHYTPRGALLVVAGDVEPDRVLDLVRRHLGGWEGPSAQGGPPSPQGPAGLMPPARLAASRVQFVEWPGQT